MNAPERILQSHDDWEKHAKRLSYLLIALGLCAVVSSVLVAAFTAELGILGTRILASVTALSIGIIAYFHIPKKIEDLWRGWKHLNAYLALYEAGKLDVERLTAEYLKAEDMVGVIEIRTEPLPTGVDPR